MKTPDQQTVTVGKVPMDALLARIMAAGNPVEKVPKRFKTRREWEEIWGKGTSVTNYLLHIGVREGIMERKMFRVVVGDLSSHPVPHYAERKSATR
jgi:hypothetical protein